MNAYDIWKYKTIIIIILPRTRIQKKNIYGKLNAVKRTLNILKVYIENKVELGNDYSENVNIQCKKVFKTHGNFVELRCLEERRQQKF